MGSIWAAQIPMLLFLWELVVETSGRSPANRAGMVAPRRPLCGYDPPRGLSEKILSIHENGRPIAKFPITPGIGIHGSPAPIH